MMTLRALLLLAVAFTPIAKYRHEGPAFLPDPKVTPGAVRTTDAKEICADGFSTKKYRHTSEATKKKAYMEYSVEKNKGICAGGCEVDHLIPLELGGLDDVSDLWPQPSQPKPGFREKDKLENVLRAQVCAGQISLTDAQDAIRTNWYLAYLEMEKSK